MVASLDPRALMTLRSVVAHGSFAAAARALGWTQPAVSQQVRKFEQQLGVTLLVRTVHGVEPTEAGSALLRHADIINGQLARAARDLAAVTAAETLTVRVVAFPSACTSIVAPAMSELLARPEPRRAPNIVLEQAEPECAPAMLTQGQADLAIVFRYDEERPPSADGLTAVPLGWDPLQLIVSRRRGEGADRPRGLRDYAGEKWVAGCPKCRTHLVKLAEREGFFPDIRHATDDYMVVQELVARDLSVSVMPRLSLISHTHPEVRAHGLGPRDGRTLSLLLAADDSRPEVAAVVAALQRAAARVLEPHPGR